MACVTMRLPLLYVSLAWGLLAFAAGVAAGGSPLYICIHHMIT